MRSYRPEELFAADARPIAEVTGILPEPLLRMGRCPTANGGTLLKPLVLPPLEGCMVNVEHHGKPDAAATSVLGPWLRDLIRADQGKMFRLFCPDETASNRLQAVFEATNRTFEEPLVATDEGLARNGRVMEIFSEHSCQGWLEGYLLSGRHGLFACYEAFVSIVDPP